MENKPSSESLAAIIVANRSLGILKFEARNAMIELMNRKNDGDQFDFEEYIKDKMNDIPKSELNSGSILSTILGGMK